MFANHHDIASWVDVYTDPDRDPATPNLAKAARVINVLASWADHNSDGWVYWRKPQAAAQKLVTLLSDADTRDRRGDFSDCTAVAVAAAMVPVKTMLTKEGADWHEVLAEVL